MYTIIQAFAIKGARFFNCQRKTVKTSHRKNLMFILIDSLITNHGFVLESWNDRYSKGVWVVLSPFENLTGDIMAASSDGDSDMIPATEYVLGTNWMPVVTGQSFLDALSQLEGRLATLPPQMLTGGSAWSDAVSQALQHFRDVRRAHSGYGESDGKFVALPESFSQVLAAPAYSPLKVES